MMPLRTLSSELELCLQTQHQESQDYQCQAEGLGKKLSFTRCKMGTDTVAGLLLGLAKDRRGSILAITQLLDHSHPKGASVFPFLASPLPDTVCPNVSVGHCWDLWVPLGI